MIHNSTVSFFSLLFVIVISWSNLAHAQTIHAIIFAASDDATIGAGTQKSYHLLTQEMNNIVSQTGMEIKTYYKSGSSFTLGNYQSVMADLGEEDLSNDVVLFYFLGHGFESESSPYPNLLFKTTTGSVTEQQLDEATVSMEVIKDELQQKNARLTILIGEACNNELDLESLLYEEKSGSYQKFNTAIGFGRKIQPIV